MTFLYGTNMECLYSMPAAGWTLAATGSKVINTAATSNPFQLPALGNIWTPAQMQGRGLYIRANGGYDLATGTGTQNTMLLCLDTTLATPAASSVTLATTGAATWPNGTTGAWDMSIWMSCVSTGSTISTWYTMGQLTATGTQQTGAATTFLIGNSIAAGVPTAITVPTNQAAYVDLYANWASAPTAFVCSQFQIYGLN